jgi:Phage integrase family
LQIAPVRFEHLFDFSLIEHYVLWHTNEKFQRPTITAKSFLTNLLAMTHQYRPNTALREQLKAFSKRIGKPAPVYDKLEAWVPLREIDRVGIAIWPKITAKEAVQRSKERWPGRFLASHAGLALMLRLWRWIPLRQRKMRELRPERNLYQAEGLWRLRFSGDELKVGRKQGRINALRAPFPLPLVPMLETYLRDWRPLLKPKTAHLFLNAAGSPYTDDCLHQKTSRTVYSYTGKYWHPHIIRTVWATEWIRSRGDFATVATMLGDSLETIIRNYAHLLAEEGVEKAFQWVERQITPNSPKSTVALSAEAKRLLATLAEKLGISQSAVLELLNRTNMATTDSVG